MPIPEFVLRDALSVLLVLVLVLSAWSDARDQRIPNALTIGGLTGALLLRGLVGPEALQAGVLGGSLGFSLGILLFAAGALGAGDGKLLAAVGAFLGLDPFLRGLPLIGAFGGVLALVVTYRRRILIPTLAGFGDFLVYLVTFGRHGVRRTLQAAGAVTVPYGIAIAAGTAMAWLGWGLSL